jgi:2-polyprenyl-3-methyl-5-hydroxy-6-metoxy-1,4-benzoquinol methylase
LITSWSSGIADKNMDEAILVELAEIITRHPWWAARGQLMIDLLRRVEIHAPAEVLDAGCGWGTNLTLLEQTGYDVTGLDISRKSLQKLDRIDRKLVEADLNKDLPVEVPQFDAVLALDVIEHIDDDCQAAQRLRRLVNPGGRLILSVPAIPELYSEFDEIQGHRRRYTAESLRSCLEQAGLTVEDILWWGQWMVRPLQTRKSRRRSRPGDTGVDVYRRYLSLPPWPLTWAMGAMFRIDHRRTLRRQNATGTSLFAVAG